MSLNRELKVAQQFLAYWCLNLFINAMFVIANSSVKLLGQSLHILIEVNNI